MSKKSEVIQIRLTVEEKLFIMEQAEEYNMTMSDFIKYMILPEKFEEVLARVEKDVEELYRETRDLVEIPAGNRI